MLLETVQANYTGWPEIPLAIALDYRYKITKKKTILPNKIAKKLGEKCRKVMFSDRFSLHFFFILFFIPFFCICLCRKY